MLLQLAVSSRTVRNSQPPFLQMHFLEEVWKNLTHKLLSRQYTNEWEEIIKTLTGQASSTRLFLIRYVFQSTLSAIWKERNGRKHGEKSNSPATIIKGVDKAVRNRITSLRLAGVCKHTKAMETWFSVRWTLVFIILVPFQSHKKL